MNAPLTIRALDRFLHFRTVSVILDQIWMISIPLFFSRNEFTAGSLGLVSSLSAVGDLLGMVIMPYACIKFRSADVAAFSDLIQGLAMVTIFAMSKVGGVSVISILVTSFISSLGFSVWFGASDTFFSKVVSKNEAQTLHKSISVSQNVGALVGPPLGAILFGVFGIANIALLNALSFLGQMFCLFKLRDWEENSSASQFKSSSLFLRTLKKGCFDVFGSTILSRSLFFAVFAKIFVFGFIPFAVFTLNSRGFSSKLIGLCLAPYGVGVLISSLSYRAVSIRRLASSFVIHSVSMVIISFAFIEIILFVNSPFIVGFFALLLGFLVARYQIQFRSLRQFESSKENAAGIISIQGIFARFFAPIAGIIFPYFLVAPAYSVSILSAFLVLVLISMFFGNQLRTSYAGTR